MGPIPTAPTIFHALERFTIVGSLSARVVLGVPDQAVPDFRLMRFSLMSLILPGGLRVFTKTQSPEEHTASAQMDGE